MATTEGSGVLESYTALRADLDSLTEETKRQREELTRQIDNNSGWVEIRLDTWRLLAFATAMIALVAAGVIVGLHLSVLGYFRSPEAVITQGLTRSELSGTFPQVISAFLPGVLVVFTAFFGFVGVKRLQAYDVEIRDARKELREQMSYAASQQRDQLRHLHDEQRAFQSSVTEVVKARAEDAVRKALAESEERTIRAVNEIEQRVSSRKLEIDSALSDYGWLKGATEQQRNALRGGNVHSAGQAHRQITELMFRGEVAAALAVVDHIVVNPDVGGSPDDWFNISAELGRRDQELHALKACQRGLKQAPDNVDLLSHALQFATSLGDWVECEKRYEVLTTIGQNVWNWRAFVFVCDYLVARNKISDAIEICRQFAVMIPADERAYSQVAQIWTKLGRIDKVVAICEDGLKKVARGSQLGLLLADGLVELGRYDDALKACDDALVGTAEMQPSANISAIVWRRGSVFDARVIMELSKGGAIQFSDVLDLARKAVVNYRSAVAMPDALGGIMTRQTATRIAVLRSGLAEAGVTEADLADIFGPDSGGNDDDAGAQLLTMLKAMQSKGGGRGDD